jgi:uncharacterized ferredoxin-like protein
MKSSDQLEKMAAMSAAAFIAASARTAPKTRGKDNITVFAIDDEATRSRVINKMKELSEAKNRPSMARDADSIALSPVIIAIGVRSSPAGLDCGFCGYGTCAELGRTGGICAYNSIDLGIASASAVSAAARFNVDNRLMYSIGKACLDLGLFGDGVKQALAIPLSLSGKNPFFDRK